jgi:hypothetical protein
VNATLNLSRRPFRNERLPTLLLSVAGLLLAAATFRHAVVARDLLPGRARDVESQVNALEAEAARLSAESAGLQRLGATPQQIDEWLVVRASWTAGPSRGPASSPPSSRAAARVSWSRCRPGSAGGTDLALLAVGRGARTPWPSCSHAVRDDFEGAFLNSFNETVEGVDISFTVRYVPKPGREKRR